jgi:hypothetical protein
MNAVVQPQPRRVRQQRAARPASEAKADTSKSEQLQERSPRADRSAYVQLDTAHALTLRHGIDRARRRS